jgi:hypothetical protein
MKDSSAQSTITAYPINPYRQTGRTTKQMQEAPPNACFVWCNSRRSYPLALARRLNRSDLTIISPEMDTDKFHRGRTWTVIRDHACWH